MGLATHQAIADSMNKAWKAKKAGQVGRSNTLKKITKAAASQADRLKGQ